MQNRLQRIGGIFASVLLGFLVAYFLLAEQNIVAEYLRSISWLQKNIVVVYIGLTIIFGLIIYGLIVLMKRHLFIHLRNLAVDMSKMSTVKIVAGTLGIIVGLILAFFISQLYKFIPIPVISVGLAAITYVVLVYLGAYVAVHQLTAIPIFSRFFGEEEKKSNAMTLVLDTSAIIDGRFIEICKTGFIMADVYIADFILKELRHIADSEDSLTRTKGRRGLDYISELQAISGLEVFITQKDYDNIEEVDLKLLALAKEFGADVVTTDYNLNKVASVQQIKVLNVNDLSNAVKPNAIAGEILHVEVIREGKSDDQGLAYLSDGTMIVIEDGKKLIGQTVDVEVTSVLQTHAGRMIFAKVKE